MKMYQLVAAAACALLAFPAFSFENETLIFEVSPSKTSSSNFGGRESIVKAGEAFVGSGETSESTLLDLGVTLGDINPGPHPLSQLVQDELARQGAESVINYDARLRQNTLG